jgi:hypothetical protein
MHTKYSCVYLYVYISVMPSKHVYSHIRIRFCNHLLVLCMYVRVYVCVCVSMHACSCILFAHVCVAGSLPLKFCLCMYRCMFVCIMYVYTCVCTHECMHACMYVSGCPSSSSTSPSLPLSLSDYVSPSLSLSLSDYVSPSLSLSLTMFPFKRCLCMHARVIIMCIFVWG